MDRRLQIVLAHFERLKGDDSWTCDGGAGVLDDMLVAADLPHTFEVGIYHWPAERMAVRRQDVDDPGEHHHWVEADGLIIDPNSELRGEPRVQPQGSERYQASDDWEIQQCSPYFETTAGNAAGDDWEVVERETLAVLKESAGSDPAIARYLAERERIWAELAQLAGRPTLDESLAPASSADVAATIGAEL
jgi:hypothetical protein